MKKIICVDFDGVIHWYRDGWQNGLIYDSPVPGAIEWLYDMMQNDRFTIAIYSSRSKDQKLKDEMENWLFDRLFLHSEYKMPTNFYKEQMSKLQFPCKKPAAFLTIDDRAFCFKGDFPSTEEINNFKPWNK